MQSEIARILSRAPALSISRRRLLTVSASGASLFLLAACGGPTAPAAPTAAPAKPTEAPKPAAEPTKPAAAPAAPAAAPAASPAAAAVPAVKTAALPNLKGTTLSVVQWSNFVADLDPFFQKQIADDFEKNTGAKVNIEFINLNDIQTKAAASIQSGSGPDIIQVGHNWAHLYKDALVDVSDVVQEVKQTTGDFYPVMEAYTKVDGKYLAVPHDFIGTVFHWRKSWFKEVGAEKWPATLDELFEVGKKLKARGQPLGQSLGHSIGDPVFWAYPMMWMYGGREVDEQGKVAINSPETIAAVKAMKDAWTSSFDETGVAWDDSSNNRAFLAGTISATENGASIWYAGRKDKSPFFDDIGLDFKPAGPKGRITMASTFHYAIMKYSKNVDAAKAFVKWSMSDPVWMPWFELAASFHCGVGPKQNNNPIWDKFPPANRIFKEAPPLARAIGWPGPADQRVSLVQSKYIIVDMFAKAVQGDTPEAAVAWAEKEMKVTYGG